MNQENNDQNTGGYEKQQKSYLSTCTYQQIHCQFQILWLQAETTQLFPNQLPVYQRPDTQVPDYSGCGLECFQSIREQDFQLVSYSINPIHCRILQIITKKKLYDQNKKVESGEAITRGTFLAMQVTMPPTESPLTRTASMASIIF